MDNTPKPVPAKTIPPPARAARLLAVEVLLADPEALGNDALEGDLYILRDQLRRRRTTALAAPREKPFTSALAFKVASCRVLSSIVVLIRRAPGNGPHGCRGSRAEASLGRGRAVRAPANLRA